MNTSIKAPVKNKVIKAMTKDAIVNKTSAIIRTMSQPAKNPGFLREIPIIAKTSRVIQTKLIMIEATKTGLISWPERPNCIVSRSVRLTSVVTSFMRRIMSKIRLRLKMTFAPIRIPKHPQQHLS